MGDAVGRGAGDVVVVVGVAADDAPRQITAAYLPDSPSVCATSGISNDPGTRTRSMRSAGTPCRLKPSSAPAKSASTISELNRAATTANRPGGGEKSPS